MTNTNTATLSTAAIEEVVHGIHLELIKRGFNVTLISESKAYRDGTPYIEITSAPFNTTPVLFQEIRIDANIGYKAEEFGFSVGGRVSVAYKHFGGGSNGCELFRFNCIVGRDNEQVYRITTT
jgi:hypothetical protein